jgi:hypothetical protein
LQQKFVILQPSNYTNLLLKDENKNQTYKVTLVERSTLHNPATPAGHPEGTQLKPDEDTKRPIREIKSKGLAKRLLRATRLPDKKHDAPKNRTLSFS